MNNQLPPYHDNHDNNSATFDINEKLAFQFLLDLNKDMKEDVKCLEELKELQKLENELELEKKEKQRLGDIEELVNIYRRGRNKDYQPIKQLQFLSQTGGDDCEIIIANESEYLLTDKKLYGVSNMGILYVFDKPISKETAPHLWYEGGIIPLLGFIISRKKENSSLPLIYDRHVFEEYVRLIPGSYKNGSWRQIGGFYGVYINDYTKKVLTYPPAPYLYL
jgi:hypothetical protein